MDERTSSEIDISAILSTYVYMDEQNLEYSNKDLNTILDCMPEEVKSTAEYQAVYAAVHAEGSTLGSMKLVSQSMVDGYSDNLIIACAFQDPSGNMYVAYRGTGDGKWVDNGIGIANNSSQMQEEALRYFDHVAEHYYMNDANAGRLIVTGHSKGGNEAQYVTLSSRYGHLIDNCYSIDGQGFSQQAIDDFISLYGKNYYELQLDKMYSINGENDYVHDLGIKVIPQNHTYFIETGATTFGGYHSILEMLNGAGLKWTYDEDGNIISCEQGPIGQLAAVLSEKMQYLNQEDLEDCAVTIMSLLEYFMPYNNKLGGDYRMGTGDRSFMTVEEFIGFLAHGLPLLAETLLGTPEGRAVLFEYISDGLSAVKEEAGIMGVIGVLFLAAILAPVAAVFLNGISYIAQILDRIYDFIDALKDIANYLKEWAINLKDAFIKVINKVYTYLKQLSSGYRYAVNHPQITVNTYKLRNYAQRLQSVNRRISSLDRRLDSLYWQVGLLDLWRLMQADLLTGYSWRLLRCSSYLNDTATDFENVESALQNNL